MTIMSDQELLQTKTINVLDLRFTVVMDVHKYHVDYVVYEIIGSDVGNPEKIYW